MMFSDFNASGYSLAKARFAVCLVAIALFFLPAFAFAAEPKPIDKKSDGVFTGIAIVTADLVWYEQFNRPEPPQISGKSQVLPGERAAIAVLFSNAKPHQGSVKVECTITATEPNGETKAFPPGPCYDGPALPDNILYPSLLDLQFEVTESDLQGISSFEIVLRDLNSQRTVSLFVSFYQGHSNAI